MNADIDRFLNALHRGGEWAYLFELPGKCSHWFAVGKPYPHLNGRSNAYIGVHPTGAAKGQHERSTAADVTAANCLFAEFDAKDFGSKEAALAHVHSLTIPPSIIVDSGGGYHTYWLLADTFTIRTEAARERIKQVQAVWVDYVGGDPAAKDLARILRLPGTKNYKEQYAPNFPTVAIVEADYDRTYDLEQLETELLKAAKAKPKPEPTATPRPTASVGLDDAALLEKACTAKNGAKFYALFHRGDASAYGGDESAADLALCDLLAFWTGPDLARIDRLFRQSARMRPKWDEVHHADGRTYGQGTIDTALKGKTASDFYTLREHRNGHPPELEVPAAEVRESDPPASFHSTDWGNAKRFVAQHAAKLRYCHDREAWLLWDGRRWQRDRTGEVNRLAKQTVASIYTEAGRADDDQRKAIAKWAMQSESERRIAAMLTLAESEAEVSISSDQLDTDPWALNVLNGTLNLQTGELRPHDPADLITKLASVEFHPDATLPLLDRYLNDATGGDTEMQNFMARVGGYSATGSTAEEKVIVLSGEAGTGKTTFIEMMRGTLGDYAAVADFETFLARSFVGGPRPDIARLAGSRFVASVEVDEGKRLAEGLVKQISGGDTVTARHLYSAEFEFTPQLKLWLVANREPPVKHDDSGIWRRIVKLPFDVVIPEEKRDPAVKATLKDPAVAGPAVLAWLVKGCLDWQRNGLQIPKRVKDATEAYRQSQDPLADFIGQCCELNPDAWTSATDLRDAYKRWGEENGLKERDLVSGKEWGEGLRSRGCEQERQYVEGKKTRGWRGISLTTDTTTGQAGQEGRGNRKSKAEFSHEGDFSENDVPSVPSVPPARPVEEPPPVEWEEGEI